MRFGCGASAPVTKLSVVVRRWKRSGQIQCRRHGTIVARHEAEGEVPGRWGKIDSSPVGTAQFRNSLFSAAFAVRFFGFEPGFNLAALPAPADTATLVLL